MKKIVALILAVWMAVSCTCVTAFAETKKYDAGGYLAFGDSYTRGMGASENWRAEYRINYSNGIHQTRNITDSFAYRIAQAMGCECPYYLEEAAGNYWPISHNGQPLSVILDLLGVEDGFYDTLQYHNPAAYQSTYYNRLVEYFGNPNSRYMEDGRLFGKTGSVYDLREIVASADLITLQLGQSDVMDRPLVGASWECLGNCGLEFSGADREDIVKFVARAVELIYEGFDYFVKAYPLLLDYVTEQNTHGDIVLVGVANPLFHMTVSDEIFVPIGSALSALTAEMNRYLKQWAKEYGLIYVDVSNVETATVVNDWSIIDDMIPDYNKLELSIHPSPEGHAQIAREILRAVAEKDQQADRNIRVDLGRFDRVDYVLLDGQPVKNYSVSNYVLTIPNYSTTHKNLTVATVNGRKVAVTTYQISYHRDEGYSVYRIYTTNDAGGLVKKAVTAIVRIPVKLFSLLRK